MFLVCLFTGREDGGTLRLEPSLWSQVLSEGVGVPPSPVTGPVQSVRCPAEAGREEGVPRSPVTSPVQGPAQGKGVPLPGQGSPLPQARTGVPPPPWAGERRMLRCGR